MGQGLLFKFLVRWIVCSLGLWIAAALLGHRLTYDECFVVLIISGLILAIVNSIIKPVVILLSLPAILLTLGLFMLVVNGLMVLLVAWIYGPLQVSGFWSAMLAGLVIGVVNFLVSTIIESSQQKGVR
jgi:putative membrane protein